MSYSIGVFYMVLLLAVALELDAWSLEEFKALFTCGLPGMQAGGIFVDYDRLFNSDLPALSFYISLCFGKY